MANTFPHHEHGYQSRNAGTDMNDCSACEIEVESVTLVSRTSAGGWIFFSATPNLCTSPQYHVLIRLLNRQATKGAKILFINKISWRLGGLAAED